MTMYHHDTRPLHAAVADATEYLRKSVQHDAGRAARGFQRLQERVIQDQLTPLSECKYALNDRRLLVNENHITPQAMGQLCKQAKLPKQFANFLHAHESPLVQNLVIENLETLSAVAEQKVMLRTVDGVTHGVVSDCFLRMDTPNIAGTFVHEFKNLNMLPVQCDISNTKVYVKALLPRIYGAEFNEALCFGVLFSASDFGFGKVSLDPFCQRVFCSNRAMMSLNIGKGVSKTHRGARITEENFVLSEHTKELQLAAMASEFRDALHSYLSPEAIGTYTQAIGRCYAEAHSPFGTKWNLVQEIEKLQKANKLTQKQADAVSDVYRSTDRDVVPQVDGRWRLAQAVAYCAQHTDKLDADGATDLEWLAGEIVESAPAGALLAASN